MITAHEARRSMQVDQNLVEKTLSDIEREIHREIKLGNNELRYDSIRGNVTNESIVKTLKDAGYHVGVVPIIGGFRLNIRW